MRTRHLVFTLSLAAAFTGLAAAHPGHAAQDGGTAFFGGLTHPLTGIDHLLVMLAAGIWAALRGGAARWLWPAAFLAALLVGAGLGASGFVMTSLEQTIAASVIVSAAVIAVRADIPVWAGTLLLGLFALFHGDAHGAEAPAGGVLAFVSGFTLTTLALLGLGFALGHLGLIARSTWGRGLVSAGVAAGGAILLVGTA